METPSVRFSRLLLCLASYFSFYFLAFLIFFPTSRYVLSSACPFVCAAAICYSQQGRVLSAMDTTSFVPYPISEFFCFYSLRYFFS